VVVCDASVGNVVIKFFEGLSTAIFELLRGEFRRWPWGPIGYFFMRPGISRIRNRFDYERLGGAPLLGVRGTVLITHGRAKRRMIGFAVGVGAAAARARIPELIAEALAPGIAAAATKAEAGRDATAPGTDAETDGTSPRATPVAESAEPEAAEAAVADA
jgi:fatty acid/phospholipid biosynthesis enzyme